MKSTLFGGLFFTLGIFGVQLSFADNFPIPGETWSPFDFQCPSAECLGYPDGEKPIPSITTVSPCHLVESGKTVGCRLMFNSNENSGRTGITLDLAATRKLVAALQSGLEKAANMQGGFREKTEIFGGAPPVVKATCWNDGDSKYGIDVFLGTEKGANGNLRGVMASFSSYKLRRLIHILNESVLDSPRSDIYSNETVSNEQLIGTFACANSKDTIALGPNYSMSDSLSTDVVKFEITGKVLCPIVNWNGELKGDHLHTLNIFCNDKGRVVALISDFRVYVRQP